MVSVNSHYLHPRIIPQIRLAMAEHDEMPNVKLSHFLDKPRALEKLFKKAKLQFIHEPLSSAYYKHVLSTSELKHVLENGMSAFLSSVLGRSIRVVYAEYAVLTHKSFSMILDHGPTETHTVECIIDITKKWNDGAGGDIVFIPDGGEPVRISAEYNACVILLHEVGTQSFYQYVNHHAKGKRQFLRLKIA